MHTNTPYLPNTQPKPQRAFPAIALQDIQVRYTEDGPLVLDIDRLTIQQGERAAFIGPSGSGKTSLLRLINGYVQPTAGRIEILGQPARRDRIHRRRVGFVFQDFNLIERATVFQNVLWGRLGRVNPWLSLLGQFPEADKQAAMQAILEVNLAEQADQQADTLSGGQQQRVAVARVLAQEAEIILADEPVSNLDPALADDMLGLLGEVSQHHGATLLMSLHQPELAQRYAERIIGLRRGRIVFDGRTGALSEVDLAAIYGRQLKLGAPISSENGRHPIPGRTEKEQERRL